MKIVFIQDYNEGLQKKGDVYDVSENLAQYLIEKGIAESVKDEEEENKKKESKKK